MESSANIRVVSLTGGRGVRAWGRLARLLSTRRVSAFALLALLLTMTAGPITDPDFWWHLRTGQLIFETRAVPHADPFSFTAHGREWVAHEWLTELLMYAAYRVAGWGAVIVSFAALATGGLMIVYGRASRVAAHPFVAGAATLLAAYASAPMWGARPQMVSFLLASVFVALLDSYARGAASSVRRLLWLPPIMLVWVNMHGGFALGLALVGMTAAGVALDEIIGEERRTKAADGGERKLGGEVTGQGSELPELTNGGRARLACARAWPRVRPLLFALGACAAVVPLNPNGARLYAYPLETLRSAAMQRHIHEWFSPDFHRPEAHAFALLLFAVFVALAVSPQRARPRELLLLCVTAYAGLRSWRNIPVFALVAAPLLAEHVWLFLKTRDGARGGAVAAAAGRRSDEPGTGILKPLLNAMLFVVIPAGLCAAGVSRAAGRQAAVEAEQFPAAAVEFLRGREAGPIFNGYGWGGYLIWKLYPSRLVYIDGRADVYGDEFFEDFIQTEAGGRDWRARLERDGVRAVMLVPDAALATLLRDDAAWEKVFEDSQAVIFFKR